MQLYRAFQLQEPPGSLRGRYLRQRLRVPTLMLFGEDDWFSGPSRSPEMRPRGRDGVELVPDCGHFIADERPDLVAERAIGFLAEPVAAH